MIILLPLITAFVQMWIGNNEFNFFIIAIIFGILFDNIYDEYFDK